MQKKYFLLVCLSLILLSLLFCEGGIQIQTENEIVELKKFNPIQGKHCESTSMMNALHHQNLQISESLINGFAGSPSFHFSANNGFPMLNTRVLLFKEQFSQSTGIEIRVVEAQTGQEAYDSAKALLKNNIPVILRVDMRYLPYLWEGKYGGKHTSFGWHFVTLTKLDETTGFAWVTETSDPERNPIEKIRICDLMKANSSTEGVFKADNYLYYFDKPARNYIDYKKAFKISLELLIENYTKCDGVIEQLQYLPDKLNSIEDFTKTKYVLEPLFFTFHGFIETFGTGGSAFRNFFKDYLSEMEEKVNIDLAKVILATEQSSQAWCELALECSAISKNIKSELGDKGKRQIRYAQAAQKASIIYQAEVKLLEEIQHVFQSI